MNLKELLMPLLVGTFVVLAIRNFFPGPQVEDAERSRVAPKREEINRPLDFDVDFVDSDLKTEEKLTLVETQFSKLTFSSVGASLNKAEFKHDVGNGIDYLQTISPNQYDDKCFLVALEGPTPLNYKLLSNTEDEESFKLAYESVDQRKINKTFVIYKKVPKIDLQVSFKGSEADVQRLRIFFSAPLLESLQNDNVQGIVNDGASIAKRNLDIAKEGRYWDQPTLFGSEDKYFIHSMVADANKFAQRAYYKVSDNGSRLISILESSKTDSDSTWTMSFYFGPKKLDLMQQVDTRLNGSLEFGMWDFLCKPALKVLNIFYSYAKNYGIAIILLTLLIKLLLLPFSWKGQSSFRGLDKNKKEMERKLEHLKEKYRNDPQAFQRAQAELIRKHMLPGFGGGCLGMLLQLPVFFALQRVLANAIELYQAPFLWINNLSMPDPYYILPVLTGIGMIASGLGSSSSKKIDPKQRMMSFSMALIFAAVTFSFSAGLVLYIVLNTLLTVVQNFIQNKVQRF